MPHKRLDALSHGHHMASNSLPHNQPFLLGTPRMSKNLHGLQMEVPNSSSQAVEAGQVPIATDSESPRPIGVDPSVTGSSHALARAKALGSLLARMPKRHVMPSPSQPNLANASKGRPAHMSVPTESL